MKRILLFALLFVAMGQALAQEGSIRGNVFEKASGDPVIYGTVRLLNTDIGTNTDLDGFFSITGIPEGKYTLVATYVGLDSVAVDITVRENSIVYKQLYMEESAVQLGVVDVSARKEKAKSEVKVSSITLTPKQIKSLPSTGGDPDIAQYLPVIPGIIATGDQGGQLYIRGGAPIQNLILLDGMEIYNPFHSIGFFSVFETETIRSVDVLTGGFNAEYGGRISAVVDIKTREGNKKRLSGNVSASPFLAKVLLEGPIKPLSEQGGGSISYLVTGKHSYISETSQVLYNYAQSAIDTAVSGLPFNFTDLYGKISMVSGNGSKLNIFGFNFRDRVNYSIADLGWQSGGAGASFTVIPPSSNLIINGTLAYSEYGINLIETDDNPRESSIGSTAAQLKFTYFGANSEVNYGFRFTGLNTNFEFRNFLGVTIQQQDFTTELGGFFTYRQKVGPWIFEPSMRVQLYASQGFTSFEPRFGAKLKASDNLRIKFASGIYSQNILSSVNEQDIINLFVGFLTGPEETIFEPDGITEAANRLQRSFHVVGGFEADLSSNLEMNVEGYYKGFTQLINLNRNKLSPEDPDFATETGAAYGLDISFRYEKQNFYFWSTYSLGYVRRDDGEQVYPTVFDRRHNINLLASYTFGKEKSWEAGARWNFGSPFPFTQTQGFYSSINFLEEGLGTDPLTTNPELGILFSEQRNGGRLIPYHRLDLSLKRTFTLSKYSTLEVLFSLTNAYNRANIFFIDRRTTDRVDQLPVLPSLGVTWKF
ncbi:MAG: carboxypeptidase-like regulatory domain-containing protein [Bacteroidota bacterium]